MSADATVAAIRSQRLIAILRSTRPERLADAAVALVEVGVRTLELPLTGPDVLPAITAAVEAVGDRAWVGAGTVRTVDDARRAIDAGASFLVTPTLSIPVVEHAVAHDVAIVPGILTPTEIETALGAGAPLVKLFPASSQTPDFVRQLLVPLPEAAVVPTGGVGLGDVPAWLAAGSVAVGVGSSLTGDTLETGDLDELQRRAALWTAALA